eukprot:13943_1
MNAITIVVSVAAIIFTKCNSKMLEDSRLNLSEVLWQYEPTGIFLGSPTIHRLSSSTILEGNDFFGHNNNYKHNVSIHISTNNGLDWTLLSYVVDQYWSNLFSINSTNNINNGLYLLGTDGSNPESNIKISLSLNNGKTWTGYKIVNYNESGNLIGYNTGPTPTLLVNNTIFRGIESFRPPYKWGVDYGAMLIYCDINKNITDKTNWKHTQPVYINESWLINEYPKGVDSPGYLEGNAVLAKDGVVREVLRFDGKDRSKNGYSILNHAIIMKLDIIHNVLVFDKFISLPGGHTKFVIHYDEISNKYISLTNNGTCNGNPSISCSDPRNILTLISSDDLYNWKINKLLLYDDTGFNAEVSRQYTGFHYVDWHFDDNNNENIIYMIRTGYRGANSYHNSNRITFKILNNFRQYLQLNY